MAPFLTANDTEENPEERTGFKYPDLKAHVRQNRPRLLSAALTILRAWFAAGKPQTALKTWGSYEGWSDVVRQALVWLDMPDPAETRKELTETADREVAALRQLIAGWAELDPEGKGLTAAEVVQRITAPEANEQRGYQAVRSAISELCSRLEPRPVGNRLVHLRDRVCDGKVLTCKPHSRTKAMLWRVVDATTGHIAGAESADSTESFSPTPYACAHTHAPASKLHRAENESAESADSAAKTLDRQPGDESESTGWNPLDASW